MLREGGASSTPRPIVSINGVSGILDRPPSRTMTLNINSHDFAFSRREAPGVIQLRHPPSKIEGAGKTGCALHPAVSRAIAHRERAHEHTGSAETLRPSLRNGFTAYFVLSPVNGSFATVISGILPANLTPAPRRQDHTTSPYASHHPRQSWRPRPPQPVPTFVTMADAPLLGTGWRQFSFDLPDGLSGKFFARGLDRFFD
jgi:hypothetical protein